MKYCIHCGNQIPDEAQFCTKCGTSCEVANNADETSVLNSNPADDGTTVLSGDTNNSVPPVQPVDPVKPIQQFQTTLPVQPIVNSVPASEPKKKNKKPLIIVLVIVGIVLLLIIAVVAIGSSSSNDYDSSLDYSFDTENTTSILDSIESSKVTFGEVNNGIYSNSTYGLELKAPSDEWIMYDRTEIPFTYPYGDNFNSEDENGNKVVKEGDFVNYYDLVMVNPITNDNLLVQIGDYGKSIGSVLSGKSVLNTLINGLDTEYKSKGFSVKSQEIYDSTISFDNIEYSYGVIEVESEYGISAKQISLASQHNGIVIVISITCNGEDTRSAEEIIDSFRF